MRSMHDSVLLCEAARPDLSYAASWDLAHKGSAHVDKRRFPFLRDFLLEHGMQETFLIGSFSRLLLFSAFPNLARLCQL